MRCFNAGGGKFCCLESEKTDKTNIKRKIFFLGNYCSLEQFMKIVIRKALEVGQEWKMEKIWGREDGGFMDILESEYLLD
jgi:hypothetical protein